MTDLSGISWYTGNFLTSILCPSCCSLQNVWIHYYKSDASGAHGTWDRGNSSCLDMHDLKGPGWFSDTCSVTPHCGSDGASKKTSFSSSYLTIYDEVAYESVMFAYFLTGGYYCSVLR